MPITRNNIEASKKHVRGALLDYVASETELSEYLDDFRKFANIGSKFNELENHCIRALGKKGVIIEEISPCISEFVGYLVNIAKNELTPNTLFKKFRETINEQYQLTSLRSTDREVVVEVLWTR